MTRYADAVTLRRPSRNKSFGACSRPRYLARRACMVSTADALPLIVKEELNIFSLGLSPNLEAEEKMWWGAGRGLDSEMRRRDDLRRQARTLFPGQRRRSRRANQ